LLSANKLVFFTQFKITRAAPNTSLGAVISVDLTGISLLVRYNASFSLSVNVNAHELKCGGYIAARNAKFPFSLVEFVTLHRYRNPKPWQTSQHYDGSLWH
jgi:hypothetical protein